MALSLQEISLLVGATNVGLVAINLIWTHAVSRQASRIESLEGQLKRATSELIDEKLGAVVQTETYCRETMAERLRLVDARLIQGDARMQRLEERDHQLEVHVLKALNELRDKVATRDDLKNLREELRHE